MLRDRATKHEKHIFVIPESGRNSMLDIFNINQATAGVVCGDAVAGAARGLAVICRAHPQTVLLSSQCSRVVVTWNETRFHVKATGVLLKFGHAD